MSAETLQMALQRLAKERTYGAYSAVANVLDQADPPANKFPFLKVAVLRNFTVEPLLPVIKGEIALSYLYPKIYLGGYDTIAQDVLEPTSDLYAFDPEIIFMMQWLEGLTPDLILRFPSLSSDQVQDEVKRVLDLMEQNIWALRQQTMAPIVINNFVLSAFAAMGILDAQGCYQTQILLKLNMQMQERLQKFSDIFILDLMSLMARLGSEGAVDERYWQLGRAPIGRHALIPLGREYGKFIRALRGKARKCLVLDCDNVLWTGIVGEEGVKSIHTAFQKEILNLRDRGVILALCSKNNERDVLEVLKNHPDMILREDHFVARRINWEDKASNVVHLAEELNIGLEAMVFVDDSVFECDLVRDRLPQVAVLCLSGDPAAFRAKLQDEGYFDTLVLSAEDKRRSQMYQDESQRKALHATAGSLEGYLMKLNMVAEIGFADDASAPRIAQLTQKTNQFNLTSRRYTEAQIKSFLSDIQRDVLYLKLSDHVSDLGLVGVVILEYQGQEAFIDTFLLSCRVLGRGVEDVFLSRILTVCRERGMHNVVGEYIPSAKNGQVANFYSGHGFQPVGDGQWKWPCDTANPSEPQWFKVNVNNKGVNHAS